jgi:potassium-transporting ATPase KdpC subunit
MKRNLRSSALAVIVLTLTLGVAYPLVVTGVSQVLFPARASGETRLLAHPLKGARYFQPRPSQDGYDPAARFFSNRGPNQKSAQAFYAGQLAAYLKREGSYDKGLKAADIPQDAVTTSASGVDPHISPGNAAIQAHRIAAVRKLPLARVRALIAANTDGRSLGILGEPGVNVSALNLALDQEAR